MNYNLLIERTRENKKMYNVYIEGKFCNPCFLKLAYNELEAKNFFVKLGYSVNSVILA